MNHRPRKRFGQHFLHDTNVLERMIAVIAPARDDRVVEIGPGEGALTRYLLDAVDRLDVVELDRDLATTLGQRLDNPPALNIHQADALKFDFALLASETPLRIVGNLPYNISTPLLFHLFGQADAIRDMHFMLQKEVVDRLTAEPGSKAYGRLGVMAGFYCETACLYTVPPDAFRPPPKVDSAVVRLVPKKLSADIKALEPALSTLVRAAFGQRRKTLRNSLSKHLGPAEMEAAGLTGGERPETVGLETWLEVARTIDSLQGRGGQGDEKKEKRIQKKGKAVRGTPAS